MVRYIQTAVSLEDYEKIARCAFEEKVTLSDLLEKAIKFYLQRKEEKQDQQDTERWDVLGEIN